MAATAPCIVAKGLSKAFGAQTLFTDISLSVHEGEKVGLIARNGTGKSTLLSILAGAESADAGIVTYKRGLRIGFLEQAPGFQAGETVMEASFRMQGGRDRELQTKQMLSKLRIDDPGQPMGQLSGGQRKRVALANVLVQEPELIILDEPTNHLDLGMIEWLEDYLRRGGKTLLMVTHDRFFLDRVCNQILELDNYGIYQYQGNYSYYLEKRQERIDAMRAETQHAANLYRRELEWMRSTPQARSHKAKYRQDAFQKLEAVAKRKIEERQLRLKSSNVYIGSKIFECQYVSKAWGEKTILRDFYYNFARFEKMGIVGGNGTGKSTFVKLLLGLEKTDSGRFDIGETVRFGYFSQDGLEYGDTQKVIDVVRDIAEYIDLGRGRHFTASQLLQHFMFTNEQQHNYVYKLSGGERRKLHLCTVLMANPNFLVLDEPTNDLDIQTLQVLEEYLDDFPGCVIVVSHDRYFMDKVVDHTLVFNGGGDVKDFPGSYTQYREWAELAETPAGKESGNTRTKAEKAPKQERQRKLTFKEKREMEQAERDIESLTAERAEIEGALSSGSLGAEEIAKLAKRLPEVIRELDEKELRWLELSEI